MVIGLEWGRVKGDVMQTRADAGLFGDREDPRRRLQAIFGGSLPADQQPPEPALAWARDVLAKSEQAPTSAVVAIKLLRRAEPRLTLRAATFLATSLTLA